MGKITLVFRRQLSIIGDWIKENKKEVAILGLILLVGGFFRLYKIADYMTFLGDEGRDAIVVRRLLVNFDPILIGPRTSIGDMYLGPLYYYLIAPALLIANFSPVGPSIMVALLGTVTIFLVWFISRKWFYKVRKPAEVSGSSKGALIAAFLYAISPVVITYSKSSWNPNIMPFFSLLSIYSVWEVWYKRNFRWLIVTAVAMAFVLQSHYLGLLLIPTVLFFFILAIVCPSRFKALKKNSILLKYALLSLTVFLFLMSPLVIFDFRHGWNNFSSMKRFFLERQTTVSLKPWKGLKTFWPIFRDSLFSRIVTAENILYAKYSSVFIALSVAVILFLNFINFLKKGRLLKDERDKYFSGFILVVVWLSAGLFGMSLYKQHVYDHYFGFIFPAPFLLIAAIAEKIYSLKKDGLKIIFTAGIVLLVTADLMKNPLWFEPNYQMKRAEEVAKLIQEEAKDQKFNLAVIAERNYEDGYQYFLEKEDATVIDIDAQIPETVTGRLFVVCEKSNDECDPTHSPKAEIANFGWSRVEGEWKVAGVTVYKLVHTQ